MHLGTAHGRYALHNELDDMSHRIALVDMNACRQPMDVFNPAISHRRRGACHTAQRKAAKQHLDSTIFDLFIRAFKLTSLNVGFADQGCDWKTIGMTPKYYSGSVPRGHAAETRAAEVPME